MARDKDPAAREERHRVELERYAAQLDEAGIRIGRLVGCGFSGGCVFQREGTSSRVYKVLLGIGPNDREVELSTRLMSLDSVHPAFVRSYGAWTFLRDPGWGKLSPSLSVIEREWLDFDDGHAEAVLSVLSVCETAGGAYDIWSPEDLVKRIKPEGVRRYVEWAVREWDESNDGVKTPTEMIEAQGPRCSRQAKQVRCAMPYQRVDGKAQYANVAPEQSAESWPSRVYCGCGCGVWWYRMKKGAGRPQRYLDANHAITARNRRRKAAALRLEMLR